jgi:hypothetical protein
VDLSAESVLRVRVWISRNASPEIAKFIIHEFILLHFSHNIWVIGYVHKLGYIPMAIAIRDPKQPKSGKAIMDGVSIVRGIS